MTQSRQPLVLEGFISEVMDSPLEATTKKDTLKVLNCLIYIRDNLSVIQFAVDNKNEPGLYRYPGDQEKGVLRDTHGTSFHLNSYSSGEEAVNALQQLIAQVEHAIQTLPKNKHHPFAEQFRYDGEVGCLELRVGPALQWAVKEISSPLLQLDDIMQVCVRLTKPGDSTFQFAKNYCDKNNITHCIYEGEDVAITEQLLKTYATDILGEDGEEEKEDDRLTTDYQRLSLAAAIVKGRQGMWQYRFNDSVAAVAFLDWLKKQALNNINKASVKKETIDNKDFFIVRLTLEQYEALKLKNSSDKVDVLAKEVMELFFNTKPEEASTLLASASPNVLNKALVIVNYHGNTPLSLVAFNQSPEAFKALVEKASVDAINKALVLVNDHADTLLSLAAFKQSPEAFKALVEKATLEALSQACLTLNKIKQSVLDHALNRLSPDAVAYFLQKVDENALNFLLNRHEVSQNIISTIAKYIIHEPSWQNPILLQNLFKSVGVSLTDFFIRAWIIAGKEIPPTVVEQMKPTLTRIKNENTLPNMKKVADGLLMMTANEPEEKNDERSISTRFNKIFNIKDLNENTLKVIWEEGLKSAIDYHYIKHHLPNSIAAQMADDLFRAERLFMGCVVPFNVKRYQENKDYSQLAKNNHLACKIIKDENWGDFVAQLKHYQQHRPALRKEIDKKSITHKFLHRTGEIIPYQLHEKANKKKDYAHTKKQSATLLSENLNTAVFGQHDPNRQLVGVLADISCHFIQGVSIPKDNELTVNAYFLYQEDNIWQLIYVDDDKRKLHIDIKSVQGLTESLHSSEKNNSSIEACVAAYHNARIIKAMLRYDRGTFDRKWTGNQEEVEEYAAEMKQLNFTNFDTFKEWANKNPYQVNEILMKFSRGSLLAIVIASDTKEARKIAMERHQNILSTFNLDLPIVFYANTFKQMPLYTLAHQADDDVGKNNLLEVDCQIRLHAAKELILKNPLTGKAKLLSLFGTISTDNILNWIEKMDAGECLASVAFMKINALIDHGTKKGDDKAFYLQLQTVIDDPYSNRQDTLLRKMKNN